MLILPVERRIDWKRPPWVTLGLMLACLFVFFFWQSNDPRLIHTAMEEYLEADLVEVEAPVYETYLQRQINLEGETDRVHELKAVRDAMASDNAHWLASRMLGDQAFYQYMLANQEVIWSQQQREAWRSVRQPIQQEYISQLSSSRLGLVPAELSLVDLIAYQFLHGGMGHIIGNLVFLFILGFTVERALGPGRYLVAYLLCGAISGLVWSGFQWGAHTPLVGASGSISGLMGMYVAIFGLQRIRFFYFVGVYFDYFRAPALAMLPVWIGKEVYDYWFAGATGIAYLAHAGGLAGGAGLVWLFGRSVLQVRESFFEPEEDEEDQRFRRAYARAMESIGRLDFDRAWQQFETLREHYPKRPVVLEHLYQLAKLRPHEVRYRELACDMMATYLGQHQPERMIAIWDEYQKKGSLTIRFPPRTTTGCFSPRCGLATCHGRKRSSKSCVTLAMNCWPRKPAACWRRSSASVR
ncbi:rhomboid family intramembrane serine protease [Tamilnaduibacter salinus]|uniref:rhomboid family intramembrane serine protease n=1 Tax=Tamilnaduibacter salinus TaxID=1484056 RepID=UPI0026AF5969|nr:rhomboid family intramembrane serine protease [Tamilnaduibacter salinus]